MNGKTKSAVAHCTVSAGDAARRLDNFLASQFRTVPKSMIYRIIRSGEVRVNGGRAKPSDKLSEGDVIRIPPVSLEPTPQRALSSTRVADIEARILYEDAQVIVLDKPAGLAVHAGTGLSHGLIDLVRAARPAASRIDLVHRLDRGTSGCLLIAKDMRTLRQLNQELVEHRMQKQYLALVAGTLRRAEYRVDSALEIDRSGPERKMAVGSDGRQATTHFKRVQQFAECCLVEATLHTGRTHQIRVHAQQLGHPLAGDEKYGNAAFNQYTQAQGLNRMFLHAARIEFNSARSIRVEAPLPPELARVLAQLS